MSRHRAAGKRRRSKATGQMAKHRKSNGPLHPSFGCVALLLQGGGPLGAYQAGVFEAMAEIDLRPNWLAGVSIGAINAAIIAGNPPENRVDKLRTFWETISRPVHVAPFADLARDMLRHSFMHPAFNAFHAPMNVMAGSDGFFKPRLPGPLFARNGSPEATSLFDMGALKSTLETLVDFDRINADCRDGIRLSVGAAEIRTGNFVYFDSNDSKIRPEHVMASGALPPAFAAVEVDGKHYWDGGLTSNTPLNHVLKHTATKKDVLAFQVDLWSAVGAFPGNLGDVVLRQSEIHFSSMTRSKTNSWKQALDRRSDIARLLDKLPPELAESPEAKLLSEIANRNVYNIVYLIYRSGIHERDPRYREFSRPSMKAHWQAGYADAAHTLGHREIFELPNEAAMRTFDFLH